MIDLAPFRSNNKMGYRGVTEYCYKDGSRYHQTMINENSKLRYLGRFDTLKEAAPRCLRGPTSKSIAPHPNPPKQWRMQRKPTTKRKTVMPKRIWTAILGTKVRRNKWLVAAVRFEDSEEKRGAERRG